MVCFLLYEHTFKSPWQNSFFISNFQVFLPSLESIWGRPSAKHESKKLNTFSAILIWNLREGKRESKKTHHFGIMIVLNFPKLLSFLWIEFAHPSNMKIRKGKTFYCSNLSTIQIFLYFEKKNSLRLWIINFV